MTDEHDQLPQQSPDAGGAHYASGKSESLQKHAQELGLLGKLFGSSEHAPLNIAGAILIFCVVAIVATPFLPVSEKFDAMEMVKLFGSIALAALTFLGGYVGGRGKS